MAMWQPKKMQWWYEAIIDQMLARPEATKKELADTLGVSYQTILLITNSDLFQMRWTERRAELNSALSDNVVRLTHKVATKALDALAERLDERNRVAFPTKSLVEVTDKMLSHLGYSSAPVGQPAPQTNVQINITASKDALLAAQQKMRRVEAQVVDEPVAPVKRLEPAA
jgi:hypothetical protein